ncbi:MAG: hypothetical protein QOE92_1526 [Chloroflexota bacterium]|nr:hypothetical protein [Chloroflexota bacterium]
MAWLDDLYNIDKHRTLHLLATFPPDGSAHLVLRNGTGVVHQVMYRRRPEHDAVMGRITYTKGTVEGDVDVDLEQASKVAFDEAFPGQKTYSVSAALEVFQTDIVGLIFERFEPYFAPHPHRTSPVKE